MKAGDGAATARDGGDENGGAAFTVTEGSDMNPTARKPVTCRYAGMFGLSAACGAFTLQHHQYAARLGLCCADAAFRVDVDPSCEVP